MPPSDSTNGPSVWLSVIGLVSLIITVIVAPIVVDWVKEKIARRNPPAPALGLNAPIDVHLPGLTGVDLRELLGVVTDMQGRLDTAERDLGIAHQQIEALQRDQEFYKFVMQQVLHWGATGPGEPPRVVPEGLRALLERGGWL